MPRIKKSVTSVVRSRTASYSTTKSTKPTKTRRSRSRSRSRSRTRKTKIGRPGRSAIYNCLKKIKVYSVGLRKPITLVKDITTIVRNRNGRKITLITGKDPKNNVGWKIIANEKA